MKKDFAIPALFLDRIHGMLWIFFAFHLGAIGFWSKK
jgi:hypothetical protein